MLTGTKRTILEIDAFLNKSILGYIVLEDNGESFLYTDDDKIKLNKNHKIKIVNGRDYVEVEYKDLFKPCADGMYLYAGRTALVK